MATKKARDLEGQLPMHGVGEADVPNLEPLALSSHGLSGRETLSGAEVDVGAGSTGKEQRQEFFLPVSGFVWLYPEEVRVVDHPTFQRLGRINQLGQTYVVYRGATHKRIEHSLGAVHVAQRMIEAVEHNGRKNQLDGETRRRKLRDSEWRFIRLGALLHDIGHLAAGHTIEDELSLLGKHDADRRLDKIFESDSWLDEQGRTLAKVIDGEYAKYVPASLRDKVSASVLVRLLIRKTPGEGHQDDHGNEETLAAAAADFAHQVCKDMIGNTICADILDYLYRDWYHIGKPRPFDDRLLQYMEVRTVPNKSDCFVYPPESVQKSGPMRYPRSWSCWNRGISLQNLFCTIVRRRRQRRCLIALSSNFGAMRKRTWRIFYCPSAMKNCLRLESKNRKHEMTRGEAFLLPFCRGCKIAKFSLPLVRGSTRIFRRTW